MKIDVFYSLHEVDINWLGYHLEDHCVVGDSPEVVLDKALDQLIPQGLKLETPDDYLNFSAHIFSKISVNTTTAELMKYI